jgi:hypothetical protein
MNLRPMVGILIIWLMLQYSVGGLCVNAVIVNNSGMVNSSITVPANKTIGMLNTTPLKEVNTNSTKYKPYPLGCPNWDNYKDKHHSPITNFGDYWDDLKNYVTDYKAIDDYNIQLSKDNYNNNSGYFSGNPISGDMDYRYMPTSKLNEAYSAASVAKSRIAIPNSESTSLQAAYTIAAVVLGVATGICSICTTIAGALTASTAGTTSPVLIAFIVLTGLVVATTIAIGVCTGLVVRYSSGINVEAGKIDNRLAIMNAELTYRSTLPQNNATTLMATPSVAINNTKNTLNVTKNNKTLANNTTNLNTTTNITSTINLNKTTELNSTTNSTNATNIIGTNDVPPSNEPIPANVTSTRSGTYMDKIYDIDISSFPAEPSKPHPKWYEFWKWIEYGWDYAAWIGNVIGWGFSHLDSLNKLISLCKDIQLDYRSL